MRKMNIVVLFVLMLSAITLLPGYAQDPGPESARKIVSSALGQANAEKKNVLLIFHASWCKWCKKLDTLLEQPGIKELIDRNYVITRIDVQETGDKKQTLENPDGGDVMKEFKGENAGLPFYVFLARDGKMIANSNALPDSSNIGYPGSKEEIAAFVGLIRKAAPGITVEQSDIITTYFTKTTPH